MINSKKKIIIFLILCFFIIIGIYFWFTPENSQKIQTEKWQTLNDNIQKITFSYPAIFPAKYIFPMNWPPTVVAMNVPYVCVPSNIETGSVRETKIEKINEREYCVTILSEKFPFSVYTQHTYVFPKEGKQIVFSFSFRKTECASLDEYLKLECEKEQTSSLVNEIVDAMAKTLKKY